MKTKHTPGPWENEWSTRQGYTDADKRGLYVWNGDDQEPVICAIPDDERADGSSRTANARLIAAAPDLLAVLKSFPGFTDNATVGDQWIERVRAVVAKVEGAS